MVSPSRIKEGPWPGVKEERSALREKTDYREGDLRYKVSERGLVVCVREVIVCILHRNPGKRLDLLRYKPSGSSVRAG
jgi:hypothetical protein